MQASASDPPGRHGFGTLLNASDTTNSSDKSNANESPTKAAQNSTDASTCSSGTCFLKESRKKKPKSDKNRCNEPCNNYKMNLPSRSKIIPSHDTMTRQYIKNFGKCRIHFIKHHVNLLNQYKFLLNHQFTEEKFNNPSSVTQLKKDLSQQFQDKFREASRNMVINDGTTDVFVKLFAILRLSQKQKKYNTCEKDGCSAPVFLSKRIDKICSDKVIHILYQFYSDAGNEGKEVNHMRFCIAHFKQYYAALGYCAPKPGLTDDEKKIVAKKLVVEKKIVAKKLVELKNRRILKSARKQKIPKNQDDTQNITAEIKKVVHDPGQTGEQNENNTLNNDAKTSPTSTIVVEPGAKENAPNTDQPVTTVNTYNDQNTAEKDNAKVDVSLEQAIEDLFTNYFVFAVSYKDRKFFEKTINKDDKITYWSIGWKDNKIQFVSANSKKQAQPFGTLNYWKTAPKSFYQTMLSNINKYSKTDEFKTMITKLKEECLLMFSTSKKKGKIHYTFKPDKIMSVQCKPLTDFLEKVRQAMFPSVNTST